MTPPWSAVGAAALITFGYYRKPPARTQASGRRPDLKGRPGHFTRCMFACMDVCIYFLKRICIRIKTFWGNRLQKSCLLVFWLSGSVAWNACRICVYACSHVCMYIYVEIFAGFFTACLGQSQFIDAEGDMCQLQFCNLFLFSSSAIPGFCKVLYASSLNWVHLSVLTVHAQCTYSARTVHGHSARARNAANTTENCPKASKQRKNRFQVIFM